MSIRSLCPGFVPALLALFLACTPMAASAQGGDLEPNDTPSQAVAVLVPYYTTYGAVSSSEDVDYFTFMGTAGQEMVIWVQVSKLESELAPTLAFYRADGKLLAYNDYEWNMGTATVGRDPILYLKLPQSGRYYIAVLAASNFHDKSTSRGLSHGPYGLVIAPRIDGSFVADGNEPNDSRTAASKIELPYQSLGANLLYFGDIDWYRLSARRGERLSVDIDALELQSQPGWEVVVHTTVGLFDAAGILQATATPQPDPDTGFPGDPALAFDVPQDGVYYIAVSSSASSGFSSPYANPDFLADPNVSSAAHRIGNYRLRLRNLHATLFPQIATGSFGSVFFSTSIVLINPHDHEASGHVSFYAPDGNPLEVSLSSTGTSATPGYFTIPSKGSLLLKTDGTGPGTTGYARVVSTEPLGGNAIFSEFTEDGQLLTEAAVPAAEAMEFFILPVDVTGEYNTGVAVANPSQDRAANLYFKLVSTSGGGVDSRSMVLPPGHQVAIYVSGPGQLFPGVRDFRGSLQVFSDIGIPAVALRSSSRTLTTLPAAAMNQSFEVTTLHFPHVLLGTSAASYRSTVVLTNPGYFPVSGTIRFFRSDGTPMVVHLGGRADSVHPFTIGAQGSAFLESLPSQVYEQGYAVVEANHAVGGAVILSQHDPATGALVTEVAVTPSSPNRKFLVYVESGDEFNTGIALANVQAMATDVEYLLHQNAAPGEPAHSGPITFEAGRQSADLISGTNQLFSGFTGTGCLEVIASNPVAAIAIRLTARTLTAVPVMPIP